MHIVTGTVALQGVGKMLFAEFLSALIGGNRNVGISWLRITQRLLQGNLSGGGVQQIMSAQNVAYPLPVIIDHNRQLVGEEAVTSA